MRSSRSLMYVSSFGPRTLLTFRFQKKLTTRPNTAISVIRRDPANTRTIFSSVWNGAMKIRTSFSEIQRNELRSPQDRDWTVSTTHTLRLVRIFYVIRINDNRI